MYSVKTKIKKFCAWLKVWLKENKIFFETITAFFLSLMAVIVSYQAKEIASTQIAVTKSEHLPFFHFVIDQQTLGHDDLIISNTGSQLSEFTSRDYIFWIIKYGPEGQGLISVTIPVVNYYPLCIHTNQPIGKLIQLHNEWETVQQIAQLDKEFSELARKNKSLGFISIERYILVEYRDIWNEFHKEMYSVDYLGGHKLSKIEEKQIIKDYENKIKQEIYIDLTDASAELLYEKWKTVNQPQSYSTKGYPAR